MRQPRAPPMVGRRPRTVASPTGSYSFDSGGVGFLTSRSTAVICPRPRALIAAGTLSARGLSLAWRCLLVGSRSLQVLENPVDLAGRCLEFLGRAMSDLLRGSRRILRRRLRLRNQALRQLGSR